MSLPPQKLREAVFQMLYSLENGESEDKVLIHFISDELAITKKYAQQAYERAVMMFALRASLDEEIASVSQSYSLERIQSVERTVLRLSVYELFHDDMIPPKVAISEGMRLAKKFGSPESSNFVNALLDALYKKSLGQSVDFNNIKKMTEQLLESEKIAEQAAQESGSQEQNEEDAEEQEKKD